MTNDIELLIFDFDGTIFCSDRANFEAIKRAISEMGLKISIDGDCIRKHTGESSEQFYKNILPPDKFSLWKDVRIRVRANFDSSISQFGNVSPGVLETLNILKRRGYTLALYSNCSIQYFNAALPVLGIKKYFDYIECCEENNLTKPDLIRKITGHFSNVPTAVIGDRVHDVEAAQKNDAISIGALYGYGRDEPNKADITISTFPELLDIFDRKFPIFEKILHEINERKQNNRPFVVGITGVDTSGKTKFAETFEKFLLSKKHEVQVINLDDFHNPQEIRYSGENQNDNYYKKSFDTKNIVEKLLIPIHRKNRITVRLTLLNLYTNNYEVEKTYFFDQDTIVIFEGVFLLRRELSPYIDYTIFLEIPFEESKRRAKERDRTLVLKKYDKKYLPAQRKYLKEFPPSEAADMIIDNTNWEYPKMK